MKTSGGAPWTPKGPVGSLEFPGGGRGSRAVTNASLWVSWGSPGGPSVSSRVYGGSWGSPGAPPGTIIHQALVRHLHKL